MCIPINTKTAGNIVKTAGNIRTRRFTRLGFTGVWNLIISLKKRARVHALIRGYTYHWLLDKVVICVSPWTQLLYWLSTPPRRKMPITLVTYCQNWLARNINTRYLIFIRLGISGVSPSDRRRLYTKACRGYTYHYYMAQWYVYPLKTAVV